MKSKYTLPGIAVFLFIILAGITISGHVPPLEAIFKDDYLILIHVAVLQTTIYGFDLILALSGRQISSLLINVGRGIAVLCITSPLVLKIIDGQPTNVEEWAVAFFQLLIYLVGEIVLSEITKYLRDSVNKRNKETIKMLKEHEEHTQEPEG
jgi:hypothetical protein